MENKLIFSTGVLTGVPVGRTGRNSLALHDDAFYRHSETIAQATDIGLLIHERSLANRRGATGIILFIQPRSVSWAAT